MLTGTLVVGVAGKDYLHAGDGNDTLTGQGGADLVVMFNTNRHSGDDVIHAGAGDDMVNAGGGDDYIDAGSRNDEVAGYQGDDEIQGGDGDDRLVGDYASQALLEAVQDFGVTTRQWQLDPSKPHQAHGNDYIDGGAGDDWMSGNGEDDVLFGGSGNASVYSDAAASVVPGDSHDDDYLDGEDGNDWIEIKFDGSSRSRPIGHAANDCDARAAA